MEPELIAPEIKRLVANLCNRDVSDGSVRSALEIMRVELTHGYHVANGRTWLGVNGERYFLLNSAVWMLNPGQENAMIVQQPPHCWQPTNSCCYWTGHLQGPSAWCAGNIRLFAEHLRLPIERELLLFTFMVLTLMPEREQLALELTGESSSGTTRLLWVMKHLVDPCVRDELIRQHPTTVKALDTLAWQHHALALDNVEAPLPEAVQRRMFELLNEAPLVWGDGRKGTWSSRLMVKRSVLFSAQTPVVTHRELRSRILSLEVPPLDTDDDSWPLGIDPHHRISLGNYDLAMIRSGILSLMYNAHAQIDQLILGRRVPEGWRDFCRVGAIVSQALHGNEQPFWAQYEAYRHERDCELIEEDPVASAIVQYFDHRDEKGVLEKPVGDWLNVLEQHRPAWATARDWPQSPKGMGAAFKRVAPLLRTQGFICNNNGKRGHACYCSIGPQGIASRHF
nr:hypothetical protein [uncultured Halomonas sp.]